MAGIMDFLNPDDPMKQQSLLAAAAAMLQGSGDPRRPFGFGQALAGGVGAYQQNQQAQQLFQQQQQGAQQQQALRDLQMKAAQNELDDHDLARQHAAGLQDAYANFGKGSGAPPAAPFQKPQSAAGVMGGLISGGALPADQPAPAPAPQGLAATDRNSIAQQHLLLAQALRAKGYGKEAQAEEETAFKLQPKYSTDFRVARGDDGKLHNYQLADDGTRMDSGLGVRPDLTEVDLGGARQFVDKNSVAPGAVFRKSQSPDSIAADRRAAAGGGDIGASLDSQTLDFLADQALRGDSTVYQNLGRGAQGAANLVALRTRVAQKAQTQGLTGADLASIGADYQGQKAGLRTSGTISARIENAASEAAQLAPLAIAAGRNVTRSGFLPFGQAQVLFDTKTNDPALNKFAAANVGLATAYASAMARGGKATVSDNQHARDLLSTAKSQEAYEAIVGQMMQEIEAARAAPNHVRENLRGQINGRSGGAMVPNPMAPTTPAAGGWSIQRVSP